MVLDVAKRNRETFAWMLVGFVGASVFVEFVALFVDPGFVRNAAGRHLAFVSPILAGALALAVWLVSLGSEATGRARTVVLVSLGLLGTMLGLGVIAWLGGLTLDSLGQGGGVKTMSSLRFLVAAGLVGAVAWFGWLVLQALPAPIRPQPQPHPSWGPSGWDQQGYGAPSYPQHEQPFYGHQQYGQPQYGQPQYGQPRYADPAPRPERSSGLSIFGDPDDPDDPGDAGDVPPAADDTVIQRPRDDRDDWPPPRS